MKVILALLFNLMNVFYGYPLQGVCKYKFKRAKTRHHRQDLSQRHHISPRQFKKHPVIRGVDLEDGANLMLMPNRVANEYNLLNTNRPVHDGGHLEYNKFVEDILDDMIINPYSSQDDIFQLISCLRQNIRHSNVPWC